MRLVIVTGISGAGKVTALKIFEDNGYYCVDNLPIDLIESFADILFGQTNEKNKVARERVVEKLVDGTIILDGNTYRFKNVGGTMVLPLTRRSYSCEGFRTIFAKFLDKNGKNIKVIRSNGFSAPKCYIPFKPGIKVRGYIRIEDNIQKFDLRDNGFN